MDYDDKLKFTKKLQSYLGAEGASETQGLVIGDWGAWEESYGATDIVNMLVTAKDTLSQLKSFFWADVVGEECEISWIENPDLSPIFQAFPCLEQVGIRGDGGLRLGKMDLAHLRHFTIESGGLGRSVILELAAARLPRLEHLELYLGDENYGGYYAMEDLQAFFEYGRFPKLSYLGLRNSDQADAIAKAIANAPVLDQISTLDLSLGTLSDEGAQALLDSPKIRQLEKLDLSHHFCSDKMTAQLRARPNIIANEQLEDDDDWRYVAISE